MQNGTWNCRNLNILAQESANQEAEKHISIMMIGWWAGGSLSPEDGWRGYRRK